MKMTCFSSKYWNENRNFETPRLRCVILHCGLRQNNNFLSDKVDNLFYPLLIIMSNCAFNFSAELHFFKPRLNIYHFLLISIQQTCSNTKSRGVEPRSRQGPDSCYFLYRKTIHVNECLFPRHVKYRGSNQSFP